MASQPQPNQLLLDGDPAGLGYDDHWALSGKVVPRQYRAVSIKENTNDGTYTITALRHDPTKYAAVDNSAALFAAGATTNHGRQPQLGNSNLSTNGRDLTLSWENLSADGQVVSYDIKIF